VLMILISITATLYFQFSLLIGDNNPFADGSNAHHHARSFDVPRGVKMNATLTEQDPTTANKRESFWRGPVQEENKYSSGIPFGKLSSVDSFTCCGLGHRMTRLVNAAHLASQLNFALRVFWDFCPGDVEVFHHFFGPQPREEMLRINTTGTVLRVNNEVPGYRKLIREGPKAPCKCTSDKVDFDAKFYMGLRNRFRNKPEVDSFVKANFADFIVVGLHVRAGNGEQGDFSEKNREIKDENIWVHRISKNIRNMTRGWKRPPLVYLATDTPSMVQRFRAALAGVMNVTHFPQQRAEEGHGVFFGERGIESNVTRVQSSCLAGWDAAIKDMLILSHADVVVAARPSSFTQTLPMSIVLQRDNQEPDSMLPFCESNIAGTELRCFKDYLDWCCNGKGSFVFTGMKQRYDYLKVPVDLKKQSFSFTRRNLKCNLTALDGLAQRDCIPFSWPSQ